MVEHKGNPQGYLRLFVEILTEQESLDRPPLDISPPPEQKWEVRRGVRARASCEDAAAQRATSAAAACARSRPTYNN